MSRTTFLRNSLPTLALLGVLAAGSHADAPLVQVTLDTPNLTVTRPQTGFVQYFFSGTITNLTGDTLSHSGDSLGTLFGPAGSSLDTTLEPFTFPTAPHASFTGDLFSITVNSTDALGAYGGFGGADPALFTEQGFDTADSQIFNAPANFTVTVTAPAAVPETSVPISFGLLLALGVGSLMVKARRKA